MTTTYFAPAGRASTDELAEEIRFISHNAIIDGLMSVVGGCLAVLNEHRQVLAVNETLLRTIGVEDMGAVLGLRPGEALGCQYSAGHPDGCGTTAFCSTCGAAIAMVSSLTINHPVERTCALSVERPAAPKVDLYLLVRSCPIEFEGRRFILLFIQDITRQHQWAALERVFFHDINNILTALIGTGYLLARKASGETLELATEITQIARRLAQEVKIQQYLTQTGNGYQLVQSEVGIGQVFTELNRMFHNHPAAVGKTLYFCQPETDFPFKTDFSLLLRVLGNMIVNALEATAAGGMVKIGYERSPETLIFEVWNREVIPADVAKKIFQRNFSTKGDMGRGLGTYSMKLFGEELLKGEVGFTSTPAEGTTFYCRLPV